MPKIRFAGQTIDCAEGSNLRKTLLQAGLPVYTGASKIVNCRGMGLCGQCAVRLRGSVSWPSSYESARLKLIPGADSLGLRLACQCSVHGDLTVEKFGGVWGNNVRTQVHHQTGKKLNVGRLLNE